MENNNNIDKRTLNIIKLRIIKEERDNLKDKRYTEKQITDKIKNIIEEEIKLGEEES